VSRTFLFIAAIAFLAGCNPSDSKYNADRTPKMNQPLPKIDRLFAETKPVCFGRFLIDVPKTAQVVWGPTHVGWEIVSYPDQGHMIPAQIQDKVKEIEKIKHLEEPSTLIGVFDGPNAQSKIIVGYKSRHDTGLVQLHSYIRLGKHAFVQRAPNAVLGRNQAGVVNKTGYQKYVANLQDTARRLRLREENEIPTEPGVCIEAGFVADGDKYESTSIGFRFPEFPDVSFSLWIHKTDRPNPDESLEVALKDAQKSAEEGGEGRWYSSIKTLRQGVRRMGDWDGSEKLARIPPPPKEKGHPWAHEFAYKSIGVANDSFRPYVDMEMSTGVEENEKGAVEPSLKDNEAEALWDKLTTSIRARPTGDSAAAKPDKPAPDKPAPRPQAKAPLGTQLASGNRCPQSGTWVCEHHEALGGSRRVFVEGETLSSVLVPTQPSLFQKLKGEPRNRVQETVWTLAEISTKNAT
jgi:hypothetical protein